MFYLETKDGDLAIFSSIEDAWVFSRRNGSVETDSIFEIIPGRRCEQAPDLASKDDQIRMLSEQLKLAQEEAAAARRAYLHEKGRADGNYDQPYQSQCGAV